MTLQEQLNSVMRFGLYLGVLSVLYERSFVNATYIIVIVMIVTAALDYHDRRETNDVEDRLERLNIQRDPTTGQFCTSPTEENPLMNVLVSDYGSFPTRPGACDTSVPSVAKEIGKIASRNVYRDIDDVYGRKTNDERPYYTMPSTTIPNDQTEVANWLYRDGNPGVCRDGDMSACGQRIFHRYPGI